MFSLPKSLLRLVTLAALAGLITTVLVFMWMSTKPDTFRTTSTLVALTTIRTPQESIQYLADLDGALNAGPVLDRISESTGVGDERLKTGLNVTRIGSSSTVRLTYTSTDDDAELAQQILAEATIHANNHLNRARDETLETTSASAAQALKSATNQLRNAQRAFDDYVEANGERDITRLAVNEERFAAELRVRLVTANAAVDSSTRESTRLRSVADASPTNLEAEAAARASEALLIDNKAVADALRIELDLAEISVDAFSAQARIQEELRAELDIARARASDASIVADEASFEYSSRRALFEVESTGATFLVTRASDAARRAVIAGASVAALVGLAGLWWQTAVSPSGVVADDDHLTPSPEDPHPPLELLAAPQSRAQPNHAQLVGETTPTKLPRADAAPTAPPTGSQP